MSCGRNKSRKRTSVVELPAKKDRHGQTREVVEDCDTRPSISAWVNFIIAMKKECQKDFSKTIMDKHLHFSKIVSVTLKMS